MWPKTTNDAAVVPSTSAPRATLVMKLVNRSANEWKSLRLVENGGAAAQNRHHGVRLVGWIFKFATAAYNLVRIRNLDLIWKRLRPVARRRSGWRTKVTMNHSRDQL